PVLGIIDPMLLAKAGVGAVNGGLIPIQSKISTPVGQFQFVFGREMGVYFYGYTSAQDRLFLPDNAANEIFLASIRSVKLEFPIIEYRPLRSFSTDQTSSLVFQLFVSNDHITRMEVVLPKNGLRPTTKDIVGAGIRMLFDWRHYL
ncbi:MAG: hypothetical protein ACOYNS_17265, partial [Bacteroidota bacterium]